MSAFPILDVAIGLVFVYLLLALICTTLNEWIAQVLGSRGKMLERGTRRLLGEEDTDDPALTKQYFEHPLIKSMGKGKRKPSYIPGEVFAAALTDLWSRGEKAFPRTGALSNTLEALARSSESAKSPELPSKKDLARWYEQLMERVSGTYKRRTRVVVLLLAVGVTLLTNADTLKLSLNLWQSPTLRTYVVDQAQARLEQGPPLQTVEYTNPTNPAPTAPIVTDTTKSPNQLSPNEQALLGQLFGWGGEAAARAREGMLSWLLHHLLGWALTALAVSLGAPFWFDTLNRFMGVRGSGAPSAKPTEQGTGS